MKNIAKDPFWPGRRWRAARVITSLLIAAGIVLISLPALRWFRADSPPAFALPAPDESLYRHLLQATVCITPQGEAFRGLGVLVDQKERLVVTLAEVMKDRENASADLAIGRSGDTQELASPSVEYKIAAKVVYRDEARKLVLLRLERWPDGAAALPLGDWTGHQVLHSVYRQDQNLSGHPEGIWSFGLAQVRHSIMLPHY
jgi:hypothetical protein